MVDNSNSWKEILAEYAIGPARLAKFLEGVSDKELDCRLSPESWSIRQIAHHIVDGDDIWNTCIKAALGNPDGEFTIQWYWDRSQTEWADNWQYQNRSLKTSMALFRANREHIVELLNLTPNAWERSICIHWPGESEEERITVEDVIKMHTGHLVGHLEDVQAILNAIGESQIRGV
jgi:hypothetical protein